jgi:hypothetical protein
MPLFIDETTLKSRLRATELTGDALVSFEECVSKARTYIMRRLGESRVAEIQGESGTTVAYVAADVETSLVRHYVCKIMANAVMDASGDVHRRWNNEAPFRELPASMKQCDAMLAQIEADLAFLAGEIEDAASAKVFVTDRRSRRLGNYLKPRTWRRRSC